MKIFHFIFIVSLVFIQFNGAVCDEDTRKPNIIVVLTDDQDLTLNGMTPMQKLQKLLSNRTASFANAFTSSPICCPSRASILTGRYAHNHGTTNNSVDGGCYSPTWQRDIEPQIFPVLLKENGYQTYYAGKYLNNYDSIKIPPGFTDWFGLHGNSKYYNYTLNENGELKQYFDSENDYLTDVLTRHTLNFLSQQAESGNPFFAMIAPPAPHAPFTSAKRHENTFADIKAPRTPNFNLISDELSKHWIARMKPTPLTDDIVENIDLYYRKRWQTLLAVDELVDEIIRLLINKNLFENTYFVFTSDNGYHLGQFAMPYDKRQPYETDIRVPFFVSGPSIRDKLLVNRPIALIDLAPTILEWANITKPTTMDGESFNDALKFESNVIDDIINDDDVDEEATGKIDEHPFERQILIEYWGEGSGNNVDSQCHYQRKERVSHCKSFGGCHCIDSWNNTYGCVRHLASDLNKIYCEFQDRENFVEAYNLDEDPYQIINLGFEMLPSERTQYSLRLDKLKKCSGESCQSN